MKVISHRSRLFATSALVFAAAAQGAYAQDQQAAPAADDSTVEEVIVTGSRIRRDPTTAPAPLIQLSRDTILQSGEPNVVDFLADIPALSASTVPEDTTGSNLNDGGLSLLNLRDLGAVRTLTLVDGRRHVGSNPGTLSVDVDTIPSSLVQSVEVVTGGQSAVYGADAVSGVVNFILRKDFEGLEIDGALAEINEEGQKNGRLSILAGKNFFDDRLNIYAFGEYQKSDEVTDFDIDWKRESWVLLNNDTDQSQGAVVPNDGQLDNVLIRDARSLSLGNAIGSGILVLGSNIQPSPLTDPDIPGLACDNGVLATSAFDLNCYSPEPSTAYLFSNTGVAYTPNFGTFRDQNGHYRTTNVGGDGINSGAGFAQGSRLPESEAKRFQTGLNLAITDNVSAFAEFKYVEEDTFDVGQPTFFDIGIHDVAAAHTPGGRQPQIFATSNFNIGLDNAYLDPTVKAAIQANVRQNYNTTQCLSGTGPTCVINPNYGQPTTTTPYQRARFSLFGPVRNQTNHRELSRFVLGLRGDRDELAFIDNFAWEIGYTQGEMNNQNWEKGVDVVRFQHQVDAVVDTLGLVNGNPGEIVCRVQLLAKTGGAWNPQSNGTVGIQTTPTVSQPVIDSFYNASSVIGGGFNASDDPTVKDCKPARIFGLDGFSAEATAYSTATIRVTDQNRQEDLTAFASGELWDLWGAGPIGLAVGYEYRNESTNGRGRSADTGTRLLFLNTGPDFKEASYHTSEYFGEVSLPLLRDLPFIQSAEISAAYRKSDYSTVGEVETYSVQGQWRPVEDILFRATYGEATRIPTLRENFGPATQTFANAFTDPCTATSINPLASSDPIKYANRVANCQALLGASFTPGTTLISYSSGVPGKNSGNPFLAPETSKSYTASMVFTPRWVPDFSLVVDWYSIRIDNVIAAVTMQTAANQCVDGVGLNAVACATITRDPSTYRVVDFIQGSINYAATLARGMDFNARYGIDIEEFTGHNWGRLDWSLRGNYLIKQEDFTNIARPFESTNWDSTVGLPRVRFLQTVTYSPIPELAFSWDWDWQAEQEIIDDSQIQRDGDLRMAEYANTPAYSQHDFTVRWDVREDLTLRGGVVNAFDAEPARWLGSTTTADNFDFFGRRFFIGFNYRR